MRYAEANLSDDSTNSAWVRWNLDAKREGPPVFPDNEGDALIHCGPLGLAPQAIRDTVSLGVSRVVAFGSTSIRYRDAPPPKGDPNLVRHLKKARAATENACRDQGLSCLILEPTMIYGSGMDTNITRLARSLSKMPFFILPKTCRGLRQPVHAADLAAAALAAVTSTEPELEGTVLRMEIGGGEQLNYPEIVARLARTIGRAPRVWRSDSMTGLLGALAPIDPRFQAAYSAALRMTDDQTADNDMVLSYLGLCPRDFAPTRDDLTPPPLIRDR